MTTNIVIKAKLSDFVSEYEEKAQNIEAAYNAFIEAGDNLKNACCVSGTYGETRLNTGSVHIREMHESLKKSAWLHAYKYLNMDILMSAKDQQSFERFIQNPEHFHMDNIRDVFGKYILDPQANILRGLAEVFSDLDPAFKSHEKVKIGVDGLPKRIILNGFGWLSYWGWERLADVINALASYQGRPLVTRWGVEQMHKDDPEKLLRVYGISLKIYKKGTCHVHFNKSTLRDINKALAAYYGEVLPDAASEQDIKTSTSLAKQLQYYPTPSNIVDRIIQDIAWKPDDYVLEPSCGTGRFLDPLKEQGTKSLGYEVSPERVFVCRAKGHAVMQGNFLESIPNEEFDYVLMNPPFYGKHYENHIRHALKFLKPGGILISILPVTARYDHHLLDDLSGRWEDLPSGSFKESGTNINTTIFRVRKG
tara:strand:+ start:93 stop:1358 length:1266 start_codon:yes stop_codon:yes gene_type:complete